MPPTRAESRFFSARYFDDPEGPVGGVVLPMGKLEIVVPFLALAGLIVAVSAVVAVKKRGE
jgi:hypothetical protein